MQFFVVVVVVVRLLVSAKLTECLSSLNDLTQSHKPKLAKMIYYSGSDINDFGDMYSCDKLSDTRFVVLTIRLELLSVGLGICGPKQCKEEDYESRGNNLISFLEENYPATKSLFKESKPIKATDIKKYNNRTISGSAVASCALILALLILAIIGSLIDVSNMKKSEPLQLKGWKAMVVCFSVPTNFNKLISFPQHSDNLQVLNGLRVLSMIWICVGHTYTYSFNSPSVNPLRIIAIMKEFWFRLCITPVYVVDIFFIISGFLIAFLTVAEIKKKRGKMNWPMFIVHRLIRICPIYFFMLMIFVALMKYFGESPLWPMFWEKYEDPCSYWWANTLFISNFVPTDEYSCMGWTWYISTDMQFYIITPVLILVYMKNRKIGYGLIAVLSVASIAAMFGQAYHNEYNPGMVHGIMKKDQFLNFYQKPYNRIGAYLVGIGLGFVFREFCDLQEKKPKGNNEVELVGRDSDVGLISNERRKGTEKLFWVVLWTQNRIFRIVGFLLGLSLMIMVIFIPHEFENHGEDYWSRGAKSFYLSIEHLLFSVGFALVLIPLIQGHGGLVKQFLSSKYFAVGAKISFSFYLIHPMVILFNGFNRPDSHYVSHFNYWYSLPSTIIFTTILSTLVTLILESPITNLEKIIFRR